ncbi:MAG: hypothetical protein LBS36_09140 [Oscillospiraceae bacterium]|nr:hypothetical protein [Oscillospiraceae bacterium]
MKLKKSVALVVATMVSLSVFCSITASALLEEIWPHKTQFTYTKSNPAWLSGLTVSEQPNVIDSQIKRNILIAKPSKYLYAYTPESFSNEVAQYMRLYELDESSYKSSYLYVLEILNKASATMYQNVPDEFIKEWLESAGIVYPENGLQNDETLIFARILYTAMRANPTFAASIPSGYKLEAAVVAVFGYYFKKDLGALAPWDSTASLDSVHKYFIAISKASLYAQGYAITPQTTDETVYKMMAVRVIEEAGYAIDADTATFEELKLKYMAAMLGKAYNVSLAPELLDSAIKNDQVPFYLLQAMGKTKNLTIKNSATFAEAFNLIAEKTDYFNLEHDEFYSDITNYEVYFEYIRSFFWIWPKTLMKNDDQAGQSVKLFLDGVLINDDITNKITISKTVKSQTYTLQVVYKKADEVKTQTYFLTVYQGDAEPPNNGSSNGQTTTPDVDITFPVFDAISDLFTNPGSVIGDTLAMPSRITQIINMFAPNFGSGTAANAFDFLTGILDFLPSGTGDSSGNSGSLGGIGGVSVGLTGQSTTTGGFANAGSNSPLAFGSVVSSAATGEQNISQATPYQHVSEMAAAPAGYTYVTDSKGYVLGLSMKYDAAAPGITSPAAMNISTAMSETLQKYQWLLIPAVISAGGITGILIWKKKKSPAH